MKHNGHHLARSASEAQLRGYTGLSTYGRRVPLLAHLEAFHTRPPYCLHVLRQHRCDILRMSPERNTSHTVDAGMAHEHLQISPPANSQAQFFPCPTLANPKWPVGDAARSYRFEPDRVLKPGCDLSTRPSPTFHSASGSSQHQPSETVPPPPSPTPVVDEIRCRSSATSPSTLSSTSWIMVIGGRIMVSFTCSALALTLTVCRARVAQPHLPHPDHDLDHTGLGLLPIEWFVQHPSLYPPQSDGLRRPSDSSGMEEDLR